MLRFVFGPVFFLYYIFSTYSSYKRYAGGGDLRGQAFEVVGTVWLVAALLVFIILLRNCLGKTASARPSYVSLITSALLVYFATKWLAGLWIWMSVRSTGSLTGFLGNIPLLFLSFFLLCVVPVSFGFFIKAHAATKEKKGAPKPPESPRYVREEIVKTRSGLKMKKIVKAFKGKTVIDYELAS